ncbi:MAG: type VI secretion system protein TssL, long form [Hyphomicrobiales bacterium]|nr:type VI secretion system protein TssL, long form [Hyphomicrobiales bacterium]MBV8662167.1 type VI secretion system protein TssL, long form [Hyphomicrobiales bacterium]
MAELTFGSSRPLSPRADELAAPSPSGGDGVEPLVAAAAPLLDLVGRVANARGALDIEALRAATVETLQRFGRDAGVASDQGRDAHYLLCATIDDVVLSTSWGADNVWARHGMVRTFHQDSTSGDRFYAVVSRLLGDPQGNRGCLQLAYCCLALGFEGRLRIHPQRHAELRRVRDELYRRLGAAPAGELSSQWRGAAVAPRRPLVPAPLVAAGGAAALVLLVGLYFGLDNAIERRSAPLLAAFTAAPPQLPPSLRFLRLTVTQRIARFLAADIKAGAVAVSDIDAGTLVRIRDQGVFGSGSADIDPRFAPLVDRIAEAVGREKTRLLVVGHTDNQPISTPRFPSNVELSKARAQAVADALGRRADPALIRVEGHAADQPVASNDTESGREANRRTEIQVIWRDEGAKP